MNKQQSMLTAEDFVDSLMLKYFSDDAIIDEAIRKIDHIETRKNGTPLNIRNIYYLLKLSTRYSTLIRRVYGYKSFTNDAGVEIPSKMPDKDKLISITKDILDFEQISYTDKFLQSQYEDLLNTYQSNEITDTGNDDVPF